MSDTTQAPEAPVNGTTVNVNAETVSKKTEAPKAEASLNSVIANALKAFNDDQDAAALAVSVFGKCKSIGEAPAIFDALQALRPSRFVLAALVDGIDQAFKAKSLVCESSVARSLASRVAAMLSRSLDHEFNELRFEAVGDEGHGVYAECGPLGYAGIGLGVISKSKEDGETVVQRSGIGVYLRADHIQRGGHAVKPFAG